MWEVLEAYESPAPDCPTQRKSLNTYNLPFQGTTALFGVCGHKTEKSWVPTPKHLF